ncbi:MAG: low affinity iron permease family protein [Flavisolibacter sp.]|nr:low affinity iron permease family protein [Flavisolibacter sp.]
MSKNSTLEKNINAEIEEAPSSKSRKGFKAWFERTATSITKAAGSSTAFLMAVAVILVWAVTGPIFHYSDTWQLVINTGTTIITFLMVFIIQQSQNKDSLAIQLKLNELIACEERASNRLIDVEDLTQEELEVLKKFYVRLSELAEQEKDLFSSHSVDEATGRHNHKLSIRHKPMPLMNNNGAEKKQ